MQGTTSKVETSGTINAGGSADVDIDTSGAKSLCIIIKNTGGTNAITSVTVKKSPLGTLFATDSALGTAIGSIAANTVAPVIELTDVAFQKLRLTLASTSGTTFSVEVRGT